MSFLLLALVFGSLPIGGLVYLRWRFRPRRMHANAERMLREAEERMERKSDQELIRFFREHRYLTVTVAGSAPARRILGLVETRQFAALGREWPQLVPRLLDAEGKLDPGKGAELIQCSLDLGAAAAVLARRHPA